MKPRYEISVWEDVLSADGKSFEEKKIIVIGSDTMTSESRAREPKLVTNINGTNKFTFNMYYSYVDTRTGEKVKNPYIQYLVNERKIKVFWKNEWYDLLIKQIKEDQVNHVFTYTCEDAYITELSRTGFNLTFATELENNIGTAKELVEKVIENTDWQYDNNSDIIYQETEEPVYEAVVLNSIPVTPDTKDEPIYLMLNMPILIYYSCAPNIDTLKTDAPVPIQFYYAGAPFEQDENDMLVVNGTSYSINITWTVSGKEATALYNSRELFKINFDTGVSKRYRAKRYVQSQKTVYSDIIGRYVNVYTKDNPDDPDNPTILYGYNTTDFDDALSVVNLFTNSSNFSNTSGWKGDGLTFKLSPSFNSSTSVADYSATSFLYLSKQNKHPIFNTGIQNNRSYLPNGFIVGERYILRLKLKADSTEPGAQSTPYITVPSLIIPTIESRDMDYNPTGVPYFTITDSRYTHEHWLEYTMTCIKSCPYDKILDTSEPFGLFLKANDPYWLEEAQFYKEVFGEDGEGNLVRIDPNQVSLQSVAQEHWKYFNADQPENITKDNLIYEHISFGEWDEAKPVYNNFERYSTIEASNSNRFNILQTIAEAFECWVRFYIEHDDKGYIVYKNDQPQKWVRLECETGQETGIGFVYGIDLKGITRTIKSDKISTKTIVEQNENEFGKNGFCSIARSEQNYPKENFIYNFDYYIQHGLLDRDSLYNDLYSSEGYYSKLHSENTKYANNLSLLTNYKLELTRQTSTMTIYTQYILSTEDELNSVIDSLKKLAGVDTENAAYEYARTHANNTKVQALINDKVQLEETLEIYKLLKEDLQKSLDILNQNIKDKTKEQNEIINTLTELNKWFYIKYSRFIQEGTWTSEDYWDDDLYYLDALQVAYQSSRPQISYEINVLRLSDIEEYSSKIFKLGDISFVQDVEYFGYKEDKITPYKEKVVLTEITSFFDTPDKDVIKVQNYKNQFDDLFQRITATVQNLEFAQGKYAKAANIVASDGTIRSSVIQNTFNENKDLVYGAQNESATIDNTGITVTDNSDAAKQVKVTSGGVFVTNDGGDTWKNAIRGDGISTDLLTAGRINTEQITVYNGDYPSFRWDPNGLNAYKFTEIDADNRPVDTTQFVRFDQYGVYGMQGVSEDFIPTEATIYEQASFGLTWNRFFMRSQENGKYIEISTDRDIVVNDGKTDRVVIGRVDGASSDNYGIRVRAEAKEGQATGEVIFQCDNNGSKLSGWTLTKDALESETTSSSPQSIRIQADGNIGCYGHNDITYEELAYTSKLRFDIKPINLMTNKPGDLKASTDCFLFVKEVGESVVTYQQEQLVTTTEPWDNTYKPQSMSDIQIAIVSDGTTVNYQLNDVDIISKMDPEKSYTKKLVRQYERPISKDKTETVYVYDYTGNFIFEVWYDSKMIFEITNTTTTKVNYYIPAADAKWSIDKNGQAIFHDILADHGKIAGWFISNDKIYQTTNGREDGPIKQQLSTTGSTVNKNDYSFITDAINAAIASIAGMTFKNGLINGYNIAAIAATANNAYSLAQSAYNHIPKHSHGYYRPSTYSGGPTSDSPTLHTHEQYSYWANTSDAGS